MFDQVTRHPHVAPRRIAAIVLSRLVCELARESSHVLEEPIFSEQVSRESARREPQALAVLLDDDGDERETVGADVIDAVDEIAYKSGVRVGQRITEAMAFSASLSIVHVRRSRVLAALATVAEVLLSFGVVAHVEPLDAVWLDVSGVAHLFGGEAQLIVEIEERVASLGFRTHVSIADGPRIAEALARHKGRPGALAIALPGRGAEALAPLSIGALPLGDEARSLFVRLGVLTVADFARLPRAQVVARLSSLRKKGSRSSSRIPGEARAAEIMALALGHDPLPLDPYLAPEVLVEELGFDDGVETAPQLLFVLRAMVSRLSLRLLGRAQAVNRIEMTIVYDRSIFQLRTLGHPSLESATNNQQNDPPNHPPSIRTVVELPAPLAHEGDLLRAFKAKLEQIELVAPAVGLRLELSRVVAAPRVQLDLSRDVAVSPDALPALLSELSAEIGPEAIGVLTLASSYLPEARSLLVAVGASNEKDRRTSRERADQVETNDPPRLLPHAVPIESLGNLGVRTSSATASPSHSLHSKSHLGLVDAACLRESGGASREPIFVGSEPFEVESIVFDRRLDGIEWWAPVPSSRDYLRVLLSSRSTNHSVEASVYVDRATGESYLQGYWE